LQGKWLVQNYADAKLKPAFRTGKNFNGLCVLKNLFVFWRFDLRDLSKHLGGVRFVHNHLVIFGAAPIPLCVNRNDALGSHPKFELFGSLIGSAITAQNKH
jgi:hypothetical protein